MGRSKVEREKCFLADISFVMDGVGRIGKWLGWLVFRSVGLAFGNQNDV